MKKLLPRRTGFVVALACLSLAACAQKLVMDEPVHEVLETTTTDTTAEVILLAPFEPVPDFGPTRTTDKATSTFSIDVDTAAYTAARRAIGAGSLPGASVVRAEEFINYFDYGFEAPPSATTPFRVHTEVAPAPWDRDRHLLMIGIKGYDVTHAQLPPANLVFLVDTSGSMEFSDKLPLVKQTLQLLTEKLREQDRVAVVAYAGSAGLVLPPTSGREQRRILAAIEKLEAGGPTDGGEGIMLAYAIAERAMRPGGLNRVILATDGDFNLGFSSQAELKSLIELERETGVALTVLGVGERGRGDAIAEQLADAGNGNHAYIDTLREARKVLDEELSATMLTLAHDVKVQVEFNPAVVAEYRLIGYENRRLANQDFANDRVDAGEIGAGHDVTALYEIALVGSPAANGGSAAIETTLPAEALAQLRLRFKDPGSEESRLIERTLLRSELRPVASERLRFAASAAAFAELLRDPKRFASFTLADAAAMAESVTLPDRYGYRAELADLIRRADALRAQAAVDGARPGF